MAEVVAGMGLTDRCAHCGKLGPGLQCCSVCKQTWYCGAACQYEAWKGHKKTCAPPLALKAVVDRVLAADNAGDWQEVLKWEGRLAEVMANSPDAMCNFFLLALLAAHRSGTSSTGSTDHALPIIRLQERRVELLGKTERFRDQGEAMCRVASNLVVLGKNDEATVHFQRAREIGGRHGFFSVESHAWQGLGELAMGEGRHAEGLELIRKGLAAACLTENAANSADVLRVLQALLDALFKTDAIDDIYPVLLRFREAAKVDSQRRGRVCCEEFRSHYYSARLHEARGKPHEAETEVCMLLELLRENEGAVHGMREQCHRLLHDASTNLHILNPKLKVRVEDLIASVAVQLAKLRGR